MNQLLLLKEKEKLEEKLKLINTQLEEINEVDVKYLNLAKDVLINGTKKDDRTGTGTISVFGRMLRLDLKKGFPVMTTKKMGIRSIATELAWFINGYTNIQYLLKYNNHIWDEWPLKRYFESEDYTGPDMTNFGSRILEDPEFAKIYEEEKEKFCQRIIKDDEFAKKHGNIGSGAYGAQWRSFAGPNQQHADQLKEVIEQIKNNPDSRRLLIVAWHPVLVKSEDTCLPPCHFAFQFYVVNGKLSCRFIMRSTDVQKGLPYNIASYALLTHLVALECGLEPDELIFDGGDVHIYLNHLKQIETQLQRTPRRQPKLVINPRVKSVFDFKPEDVTLEGYDPHPAIKAPVAV